jgi:hypothetical protein
MTAAESWEPLMTRDHVTVLLALLVSLDSRLVARDERTAEIRVNAWTSLLGEVDPGFAVRYAETAYQEIRDYALTPAEILVAWREDQATTAESSGSALFDAGRYLEQQHGWDPVMVDYLRDVLEAVKAGDDPESVPRPATSRRPLTPEQDAWQRRCRYHRICACDHRVCRDGFLDAEETIIGLNAASYPVVRRCTWCADALTMAIERGIAKRPSTARVGRRNG